MFHFLKVTTVLSYFETIFISYWKPSLTFYTVSYSNSTCYTHTSSYTHPSISLTREKSLSHVQLFAIPWTVAYQAPPSMGFFRQEYWSGLPFPSPGDLPNPGIEPRSPALQADILPSKPPGNH